MEKEYFTRFPNKYIQCDIQNVHGVSRKFYITYILIDRYRSRENFSWITIKKILSYYGYKTTKKKPKAFKEVLDVLEYMINNKMIEVSQDLDSLSYDTGIEIKIVPENFDAPKRFTKITSDQFDVIMTSDSSINKENLLMAFLYINSYIGCRARFEDGSELTENPWDSPEAFYKSIHHMSEDLSLARNTILKCLDSLVATEDNPGGLLIKEDLAGTSLDGMPNIYVLNKEGYEQEIQWAIKKMMEMYSPI